MLRTAAETAFSSYLHFFPPNHFQMNSATKQAFLLEDVQDCHLLSFVGGGKDYSKDLGLTFSHW